MSINKLHKSIAINLSNWSPYFLAVPGWFSALKDTDTLQKWRECAGHRNENPLSSVIYGMRTLGQVSINLSLANFLASKPGLWRIYLKGRGAVNHAVPSLQLWGAVGVSAKGPMGETWRSPVHSDCMVQITVACKHGLNLLSTALCGTRAALRLCIAVGSTTPKGPSILSKFRWDGVRSVPLFSYVFVMYMLCASTASCFLEQLFLSYCKKCYWAMTSCSAIEPLMVKQHVHVQMWVCGQLIANRDCV